MYETKEAYVIKHGVVSSYCIFFPMFVVSKCEKRRLKISGDNRTAVVYTLQTRYY